MFEVKIKEKIKKKYLKIFNIRSSAHFLLNLFFFLFNLIVKKVRKINEIENEIQYYYVRRKN